MSYITTSLPLADRAYSRPWGTYVKICDEDKGVVATKLYRSLPLNPIWIKVEFLGSLGMPPAGEIEPGSCAAAVVVVAALVAVPVGSVVVVVVPTMRMLDGIQSSAFAVLDVGACAVVVSATALVVVGCSVVKGIVALVLVLVLEYTEGATVGAMVGTTVGAAETEPEASVVLVAIRAVEVADAAEEADSEAVPDGDPDSNVVSEAEMGVEAASEVLSERVGTIAALVGATLPLITGVEAPGAKL